MVRIKRTCLIRLFTCLSSSSILLKVFFSVIKYGIWTLVPCSSAGFPNRISASVFDIIKRGSGSSLGPESEKLKWDFILKLWKAGLNGQKMNHFWGKIPEHYRLNFYFDTMKTPIIMSWEKNASVLPRHSCFTFLNAIKSLQRIFRFWTDLPPQALVQHQQEGCDVV